jgi:hypothetical protein
VNRLEAMVSIERGVTKVRCPACGHTVPSLACEAPGCDLLAALELVQPTPAVAQLAAKIEAEHG